MSDAAPQKPSEAQASLAMRRRSFFICAAALVLSLSMHPLMFGGLHLPVAGAQLAWAAVFALLGVLVTRQTLSLDAVGIIAGVTSAIALTTEVQLSGGTESPHLWAFYILPLMMAAFIPERWLPVLVTIPSTLLSLLLVDVLSAAPARLIASHFMGLGFTSLVSAYGALTYRRLVAAEKKAHHARLEALEQLADSEQRRVQAERHRAEIERLALVGQLASGVAHEVNNPLAFVKANLSFLEEELVEHPPVPGREDLREVLAETQQGVLRIQQIVTDLRQFSRKSITVEECAVADAVEEAQRLASVRLNSLGEVVREIPADLPRVRVGQRQLVQVLLNLLVNAADAIEHSEPRRPARIVLRARPSADGVCLEVEDNGPGIPPDVMPRLVEPFFTTKPPGKGTGLGLALCREYIGRAGGSLVAESPREGGARFVIQLPQASAPVSAASA
ncbi:sensor histidine kinase [Hyalangium gracile]|uniref:sensor histidine kinase n=1 Tax=Hyalangium gracile TaxID=394092 RepID=UPI001CCF78CA|nr:ATP-binding protein [Hyalangium gracile]